MIMYGAFYCILHYLGIYIYTKIVMRFTVQMWTKSGGDEMSTKSGTVEVDGGATSALANSPSDRGSARR